MRILITGIAGFVGRHYLDFLARNGSNYEIMGTDITPRPDYSAPSMQFSYRQVNLMEKEAVWELFNGNVYNWIVHLASFSSVAYSWDKPTESFINNNLIFINLIEAMKNRCPSCRVLSIGSSEEYGEIGQSDLPLREEQPLNPRSPYGVARVSQEMLSKVFSTGYGLDIVMTRSFNHIGPFQRDTFAVPSIIRQFVQAEKEKKRVVTLRVGDVDVIRDFTDVRDVVRAYDLLLQKGKKGQVYNICSGRGYRLREIIGYIEGLMSMKADIETDKEYIRPFDIREIVGDNSRIQRELGWQPERSIESSLADIIEYWRTREPLK